MHPAAVLPGDGDHMLESRRDDAVWSHDPPWVDVVARNDSGLRGQCHDRADLRLHVLAAEHLRAMTEPMARYGPVMKHRLVTPQRIAICCVFRQPMNVFEAVAQGPGMVKPSYAAL